MTRTFKSFIEIENFMASACEKAVKKTCNRLLGTLQELIMSEYYDAYEPKQYQRTMQFYDSAMTEMLNNTCGQIFMNADKMNYPFSGRGWSWDGATQILAANEGVHGGWTTKESTQHRYWDEFENYCDYNALKILKEELKRAGVDTR